ncbi:MAG: glutathione S-transferase family protein [Hyphomicrobiaceae bacterium]
MIELHGFGPALGLVDPSPFVVKAHMLLKLAGLDYTFVRGDMRKSPKGKLPYIVDNGTVVADTTLIRMHIEATRNFDFDKGLTAEQKGFAWAIEKMLEDHTYWLVMQDRWVDDENFDKGPRKFFDAVPAVLRPIVIGMVRRTVRKSLHSQGLGRHTDADRAAFSRRAIDSLAACLGNKPFLMGEHPCGADATVYAWTSSALCPVFESATRHSVQAHANLVAYAERGAARWFPEMDAA